MVLMYVQKALVFSLRTAAGLLRSRLIDFKLDVGKHKSLFERVMRDNYITDEETADVLDHFADQVEKK